VAGVAGTVAAAVQVPGGSGGERYLKGHLDALLLAALEAGPRHGVPCPDPA
jgi:hypothetical protein